MHTDNQTASAMEWVEVSAAMTLLLGHGSSAGAPVPADPVRFAFGFGTIEDPPMLRLDPHPDLNGLNHPAAGAFQVVLMVSRSALIRLGAEALIRSDRHDFHLSAELRAVAIALREPPATPETLTAYRLAKSIELLCETIRAFADGRLMPVTTDRSLSQLDSHRVMAARRLIDERCHEKLTLDVIARACGLNRAKLTRGFRAMFDCTIAAAIAEKRLLEASRLLLTTDLPISSIGYESGYLNNASFARAFGRHFGRSPSDYRARRLAA